MLARTGALEPIAPERSAEFAPLAGGRQPVDPTKCAAPGVSVRQLVPNTPGIGKNGRLEPIRAWTRRVAVTAPLLSSKFPTAVTQRSWMTRLGRVVPPGGPPVQMSCVSPAGLCAVNITCVIQ